MKTTQNQIWFNVVCQSYLCIVLMTHTERIGQPYLFTKTSQWMLSIGIMVIQQVGITRWDIEDVLTRIYSHFQKLSFVSSYCLKRLCYVNRDLTRVIHRGVTTVTWVSVYIECHCVALKCWQWEACFIH